MEVDLSYYLHCSTLSLTEAAKIMSGIEPKEYPFSLETSLGPLDVGVYDSDMRARMYKAKTLFGLMTEELISSDCQLEIDNLVAIICSQNYENRSVTVSDQPIEFDDFAGFDVWSVHPDVLKEKDFTISTYANGTRYLTCKNPPDYIRRELLTGRLKPTGLTTVTTISLAKWTRQKGIDSVFSAMLNADPQREHFDESDIPYLLSQIVRINTDFFGEELNIALRVLLKLCEVGSGGGSTKQFLEEHLKKVHRIDATSESGKRITTILSRKDSPVACKQGTKVLTEPFDEYIANKEASAKTLQTANRRTQIVFNDPWTPKPDQNKKISS